MIPYDEFDAWLNETAWRYVRVAHALGIVDPHPKHHHFVAAVQQELGFATLDLLTEWRSDACQYMYAIAGHLESVLYEGPVLLEARGPRVAVRAARDFDAHEIVGVAEQLGLDEKIKVPPSKQAMPLIEVEPLLQELVGQYLGRRVNTLLRKWVRERMFERVRQYGVAS